MHYVPLKDRLNSCCLANSRLHAAAVAATQDIQLSGHHVNSGLQWLPHYGQHVTCLELSQISQPLLQLPCPNLLQLSLTKCSVQLGPAADGTPGVIQGCTKLTRLELLCNIIEAPEGVELDSLSSLVHLEHLVMRPKTYPDLQSYSIAGLSSATLPRLTYLTHFTARSMSIQNLDQLGGLTNLQELYLSVHDGSIAIGPRSVPGLVFPAMLRKVELGIKVEAGILSLVPDGLQDVFLADPQVEGPVEGPWSLLSYVGQLQQLTRLALLVDDWPAPGPAYSSITASSSLVELGLPQVNLPASVWPHVFPPTCKLPHLTLLIFNDELEGQKAPWGAADLSSLISCCPNLCMIAGMFLQHGSWVSELHKLARLTDMFLEYPASDSAALADSLLGLAAVTPLQNLAIQLQQQHLSMGSLLPLTSLTALTSLECYYEVPPGSETELLCLEVSIIVHIASGLCIPHGQVQLVLLTSDAAFARKRSRLSWLRAQYWCFSVLQATSAPDVWLQLLERCAADPDCQPTALRSLAEQLAEQKALTAQQQHQLAVQQQVAAAQGARIAALEGQLQQLLQHHTVQ